MESHENKIKTNTSTLSIYTKLFDKFILGNPIIIIILFTSMFFFMGYQLKHFRLDASADSLILEHDKDLKYFRKISSQYASGEYLVVAYLSDGDLFSDEKLLKIKQLRDDLKQLDKVSSVVSILDVPLFSNPPVPIKDIRENIKTLESPDVDKTMAKKEIVNSPIYRDLLISKDMGSLAFQVNLGKDEKFESLSKQQSQLKNKKLEGTITPEEFSLLQRVNVQYAIEQDRVNKKKHELIGEIRKVINKHKSSSAQLFLGGVAMITDDMVTFIKNDIKVFGLGMLCFLIITLWTIFREVRWVMIPMFCCAISAIIMTGIVSIFRWQVTVISSNFISLQLVITMSITIHLIVRYNELLKELSEASQRTLVLETVNAIFKPCVYTTLTTIVGFSSLLFSNILPVINFGWMMIIGLIVSLFVTFLIFPVSLMFMSKKSLSHKKEFGGKLTSFFAHFTRNQGNAIYISTFVVILFTLVGISRLAVENSFIDYFRDSTEIYKGMKMIDQKLGGTTPLDVIIDFESYADAEIEHLQTSKADDDMFDEFEEFETMANAETYWFTPDKLELIAKIHDYLDGFNEIGKVLSLNTIMKVIEQLNGGKQLDHLGMTLMLNELPEELKEKIIYPYVSVENNQTRITMRIKDSMKSLKRNKLLKKIEFDLKNKFGLNHEQVHVSGVMVLYNNMLQSLFDSQIRTIGFTVLILMVMFFILFGSLKISFIALFPNLLSSIVILGVMGLFNIPLDMMTITIVAISTGIAVDDTIHYIYRFKHEFEDSRNYINTISKCHGSIGHAMYYTSITIIIGFSILGMSNFIPSVLFGLLTGLAMIIALVAALTLLPRLIILLKPFGSEQKTC